MGSYLANGCKSARCLTHTREKLCCFVQYRPQFKPLGLIVTRSGVGLRLPCLLARRVSQ